MKHLYFIRHGQSELNALGIFAGRIDTPLTELGRQQAAAAAKDVQPLGIDLIVASNLGRAIETAQIIARGIGYAPQNILCNELFTEQRYGQLEGKPWSQAPDITLYPDIEQEEALIVRVQQALNYLNTLAADTILLVSHGAFGKAMLQTLQNDYSPQPEPDNAVVVQFI